MIFFVLCRVLFSKVYVEEYNGKTLSMRYKMTFSYVFRRKFRWSNFLVLYNVPPLLLFLFYFLLTQIIFSTTLFHIPVLSLILAFALTSVLVTVLIIVFILLFGLDFAPILALVFVILSVWALIFCSYSCFCPSLTFYSCL